MNPAIWLSALGPPSKGGPRRSTVPFSPLVRPRGTVLEASASSQSTAAWLSDQWVGSGRLLISATQGNGSSKESVLLHWICATRSETRGRGRLLDIVVNGSQRACVRASVPSSTDNHQRAEMAGWVH